MTPFELLTLGQLELTRNGAPVLVRRRKELALLAYLARRGPRSIDRPVLASLLWGARGDDAKARVSLRQALFDLREIMGDALQTDAGSARLDPRAITLDLASFEAGIAAGRLAEAAELYRGPFLDGLEDLGDEGWTTWVESERSAARTKLAAALEHLVTGAVAGGERAAAIRWAERLVETLPYDEPAATSLVGLYVAAGQIADAKSAAAAFEARLRDDLDAEPSSAFGSLVTDLGPGSTGPRLVRGLVSPDLVGREAAMAALANGSRAVREGAGRVIVVEGGEGSGKSRLLETFAAELAGSNEVLQSGFGRAFRAERDRPWSTLRPVLARLFVDGRGVAAVPPECLAGAAAVVPELRERFPTLGSPPRDPGPPAAVHRILAEMAAERPLALLVDDASDADPASAEVLAELVRRTPPGLLVVLSEDPTASVESPFAFDLRDSSNIERLDLGPISAADARSLIGSMAPFDFASQAELTERLHRETAGNPGQLVRMVRQLGDDGSIGPGPDGVWTMRHLEGPLPLAAGVREAVRSRLAELPAPLRRLVDAAAALGPAIDPRLLESLARLDPDGYRDALGTATSRRLLRDSPARPGRLEFTSEAHRRAVYDMIPPSRRALLHRRAAAILARESAGAAADAAELSRHRSLAGPMRRRAVWGVTAVAIVAAATLGATLMRERAARVAPGTPVLVAAVRNATGDADFDGSLQTAAEIGLQETGHVWVLPPARIADALARAGRGGSDTALTGDLAREVAMRENVPVVIELGLAKAGTGYLVSGRIVAAGTGSDLRAFQTRVADREHVLDGLSTVVQNMRRALGSNDSLVRAEGGLPTVTTRSLAALKLFADGEAAWNGRQWELATSHWRRAVAIDSTFAMAHVLLGRVAFWRGNDRPGALAHLAAARRFAAHLTAREQLALEIEEASVRGDARAHADLTALMAARFPTPVTLGSHGSSLMRARRCAEAVPVFRRALELAPRNGTSWINLATCYQFLDRWEEALEAYAEAERLDSTVLVRDNLNHEWGGASVRLGRYAAAESAFRRMLSQPSASDQARGWRSLGYLAITRGDYRAALASFDRASEIFAGSGVRLSAARSETGAAQAAANLGDTAGARGHLARAREQLRGGPIDPVYPLYLGSTHLRVGDVAGARAWLARLDGVVGPGGAADSAVRNLLASRIALAEGRETLARTLVPERLPASVGFLAPAALETLGRIHWTMGYADSAIAAWTRARAGSMWGFEMQDEWERIPLPLADALLVAGDSAGARLVLSSLRDQWRDVSEPFPGFELLQARLRSLQASVPR